LDRHAKKGRKQKMLAANGNLGGKDKERAQTNEKEKVRDKEKARQPPIV